jgi:predicted amidohydrolase
VIGITEAYGKKILERNRKEMETRIREAASEGAKYISLSEFAQTGYPLISELTVVEENYENPDQVRPYSEPIPGPGTRYFGKLAKELGVWIQFGMAERAKLGSKEVFYNSAVVINDQGQLVATHRKNNFYDGEDLYLVPGREATTFKTPVGTFGLLICADVYDYNLLGRYARAGVNVLSLSTSWAQMNTGMDYFRRAARNNQAYLLAANQMYYPDSGVVNPDGTNQSHVRQSYDTIAYGFLPLMKGTQRIR